VEGEPFVRSVKLTDPSGVLLIETALGHDYVMSTLGTRTLQVPTAAGEQHVAAHFAVVSVKDQKPAWTLTETSQTSSDTP
jgi:hypothetical protein